MSHIHPDPAPVMGRTGRFLAGAILGTAALAVMSLVLPLTPPRDTIPPAPAPAPVAAPAPVPAARPAPVSDPVGAPAAPTAEVPLGSEFGRAGDRAPMAPADLPRPSAAMADAPAPPAGTPDAQPATEAAPQTDRPSTPAVLAAPPAAAGSAAQPTPPVVSPAPAITGATPATLNAPGRDDRPVVEGAFATPPAQEPERLAESHAEPLGSVARDETPAPDLSLPPDPSEWNLSE